MQAGLEGVFVIFSTLDYKPESFHQIDLFGLTQHLLNIYFSFQIDFP